MREEPGCAIPLLWLGLALSVTVSAGIIIGLAAYDSESAGITASLIAALPVGLLWSGALASCVIKFTPWHQTKARIFAPVGIAVVGGVLFLALVAVFIFGVFPAL